MMVRLLALAVALAITAFAFARESHFAGVPVWWVVVPLWVAFLAFLVIIRKKTRKT